MAHRCRVASGAFAPAAIPALLLTAFVPAAPAPAGGDPESQAAAAADTVVAYTPGLGVPPGFDQTAAALGPPARFSGAGLEPGVVSPFQPAFTPAELLVVGRGGSVVLAFDEPVLDDPANPFGVDLLVFGNAFLIDLAFPTGLAGGLFAEGGRIEVSPDGVTWTLVPEADADGGFPTLGWRDAGPYDAEPGRMPTDFTRPVDPAIDPAMLAGTSWPELLAIYDGSGGGTPVDLAPLGLVAITHVRISVPVDAPTAIELDAVMDVAPLRPAADVDGDGLVGFGDVLAVLAAWGGCPGPPADCPGDVDGDGVTGFGDLLAVLAAWSGP
ncbi:MAG: hypothetical protein ACYTEV_00330 [Planctomycetota bacterium]|jgi:hypothetical protein